MVVYALNSSTEETEAGGLTQVQAQLELYSPRSAGLQYETI